ncbi:hypothetical protein C3K47_06735 [Solitalea longa]|uniref:Uncharacterized protein n=1 Tax=Solitalea longa TaxID=2079460 RepID=A0A2S5A5S4_9SPHI|nr:hypothetical protein [Solitalea longa]POY37453.1 hypothetical protein C3K47_06735 [Solitalea longa]
MTSHYIDLKLLLIISILELTSCASINYDQTSCSNIILSDTNSHQLIGMYHNRHTQNEPLFSLLVNGEEKYSSEIHNDSIIFKLIQPTNRSMSVEFYRKDSLVRKKTIQGKFKNGYFLTKAQVDFFKPCFPLLWGPGTYKRAIGLTKNKDLIVLESHGGTAIFIVIPFFASGGESSPVYRRVE